MYIPVMIQMYGKKVVVFGGGKIAYRKCISMLQCGGKITVVSKDFTDKFYNLNLEYPGFVSLHEDEYKESYLKDCQLVIAATNNSVINQTIVQNCHKRNILCNVVDNGEISDFILPSVVRRGDLIISVSTSGKSPSLSKKIKEEIEAVYTDEFEEYVILLGILREKIVAEDKSEEEKKHILNSLVNKTLEELRLIKN